MALFPSRAMPPTPADERADYNTTSGFRFSGVVESWKTGGEAEFVDETVAIPLAKTCHHNVLRTYKMAISSHFVMASI